MVRFLSLTESASLITRILAWLEYMFSPGVESKCDEIAISKAATKPQLRQSPRMELEFLFLYGEICASSQGSMVR